MNPFTLAALFMAPWLGPADGSLIVLRDSNVLVSGYTQSSWTHVAMILEDDGQSWVFESAPGFVRKIPLVEFLLRVAPSGSPGTAHAQRVYYLSPKKPFSAGEILAMKEFAVRQIGRRYSVKGILRGQSVEGMSCAQFVAATLQQTGRIRFPQTFNQTPSSVLQHTRELYTGMSPVRMTGGRPEPGWLESADRNFQGARTWWKWSTWEALHYWRD
jgi:hypothetical protein